MYILYDIIIYYIHTPKKKTPTLRRTSKLDVAGNRHETSSGRGFLGEAPTASGGCRLYWCFKDVKVDVSISSTTKHWWTQLPARTKKSQFRSTPYNKIRQIGITHQNTPKCRKKLYPFNLSHIECHQVIHSADWKPSPSLNGRVEELQRPVLASWRKNSEFPWLLLSNEGHRGDPNNKSKRKKEWMLHFKSGIPFQSQYWKCFLKICPSPCALDKKVIGPNNDSQVCLKKNMLFFNYNWQCHQWETNAVLLKTWDCSPSSHGFCLNLTIHH